MFYNINNYYINNFNSWRNYCYYFKILKKGTKSTKICKNGPGENCFECNEREDICVSCNEGYYLPEDDKERLKFKKCSIQHSSICNGTNSLDIYYSCGYYTPIFDN